MTLDKDKFRGALLGLATGDALGTTVEFSRRGSFTPMTDIVGGGPFQLKAGEWTDDTSMALCLAKSLILKKDMDLNDQLDAYVGWWLHGDNSVTGACFDIGNTVRGALESYAISDDPYSGSTSPNSAGNGSIMRLAPVPLFFATNPENAIKQAAESSKTTHGALEAVDACRYFAALIIAALQGKSKEEILSPSLFASYTQDSLLCTNIESIQQGRYKEKDDEDISGSGYVVKSLEAALWSFYHTDTFEEGALKAVNLGDDADTTGAVYGQIAGAYYGAKGIPKHWLKKLAWKDRISRIADQLFTAAHQS